MDLYGDVLGGKAPKTKEVKPKWAASATGMVPAALRRRPGRSAPAPRKRSAAPSSTSNSGKRSRQEKEATGALTPPMLPQDNLKCVPGGTPVQEDGGEGDEWFFPLVVPGEYDPSQPCDFDRLLAERTAALERDAAERKLKRQIEEQETLRRQMRVERERIASLKAAAGISTREG
jgi:hypothetical protein